MDKKRSIAVPLSSMPTWLVLVPSLFVLGMNAAAFRHQISHHVWYTLFEAPGTDTILFLDLVILTGMCVLRRCVLRPWRRLLICIADAATELNPDNTPKRVPATMFHVVREITRLTAIARDHYARCTVMANELETAKAIVARYVATQDAIIASTNREMTAQYQSVLAYAHNLEERIATTPAAAELRHDLDDVCESGMNLKLIASALQLFNHSPVMSSLRVADTMKQMMLALAPCLERRNMKLSTTEVDLSIAAHTDPGILSHTLWMMLLGIVRYAEHESTLRMRCLYDHGHKQVLVSIVISELAPGKLSPEERGEYLARQMQHLNPHMFSDTVRLHANIQLAEMLLSTVAGRIEVVPLNAHACEICLFLPSA